MNDYFASDEIEPFFFGETNRKLFGCCHTMTEDQPQKGLIILCQTIGHEYIHGHRACYQLATKLAAKRYAVVRFDYFGCGDSEGDFEQGSLEQWATDILSAVNEAKVRYGSSDVCLIGYRMGATLAMKAAESIANIHSLVLWEPIYNGKKYLSELAVKHSDFCKIFKCKFESSPEDASLPTEILGFPLMPGLIKDLKAVNLNQEDLPKSRRSLTVFNRQRDNLDSTSDLSEAASNHDFEFIADHELWEEELYKRLIPVKTLDTIVSWVEKALP